MLDKLKGYVSRGTMNYKSILIIIMAAVVSTSSSYAQYLNIGLRGGVGTSYTLGGILYPENYRTTLEKQVYISYSLKKVLFELNTSKYYEYESYPALVFSTHTLSNQPEITTYGGYSIVSKINTGISTRYSIVSNKSLNIALGTGLIWHRSIENYYTQRPISHNSGEISNSQYIYKANHLLLEGSIYAEYRILYRLNINILIRSLYNLGYFGNTIHYRSDLRANRSSVILGIGYNIIVPRGTK